MANMTLSIPDPLYEEMKKHKEIKWSEVARKSIIRELLNTKKKISGKELLNLLSKETQEKIESLKRLDKEDWENWTKK